MTAGALILAVGASAFVTPTGAGTPDAPRGAAAHERVPVGSASLHARDMTIPTLVIYGDHDFIPSFAGEHIAQAMPAARFATMKECGHFAYLECPGPVRKEIDGFFRNPRAPARPKWA